MPFPPARLILASLLGAGLVWAALALARVDAGFGAPLGADRLLQALDADPALHPGDAARARRLLHDRPIDGRGYRVLAQIADAQGDRARADALYAIAVRRAPRDRIARATLADRAFARGDLAAAFEQLDALLRVAPGVRDPVLRQLAPQFGDARLQAALVARLAADPPWRGALRPVLLDPGTPTQAALALLDQLAARTALSAEETAARVLLLQRDGRDAEARRQWLESLPMTADATSAWLFDGGFEHPDIAGPYAWQQTPPPGVAMATDADAAATGRQSLRIDFSGRAIATPGLQQALALPPGRYRLQLAADNATDAQRPFAWRLACRSGGASLLSLPLPAPSASATGWQPVAGEFDVPPDCPGQVLRLDFLARSLAERQVAGTLRLDALRIAPANP